MNHKLYFMRRKVCLPVISAALWQPSTTMAPHRSCLDRFSLVVSGYLHLLWCARCVAQPLNEAAVSCKQPHNHTPPASFTSTATKQPHMTEGCLWQKCLAYVVAYVGKDMCDLQFITWLANLYSQIWKRLENTSHFLTRKIRAVAHIRVLCWPSIGK